MTSAPAKPIETVTGAQSSSAESAEARTLSKRTAWGMVAFAVILRILVVAGAMLLHDRSLQDIALFRDGRSYMAVAQALLGDRSALDAYDERVFVGFPAVLALVHFVSGMPLYIVGLLLNWVCAGLVCVQSALLFKDERVGWAMAALTPSYLMYSSLLMSESFYLVLALSSMLLALRSRRLNGSTRPIWAGLLLGAAASVRPVALFPAVATALVLWIKGRLPAALIIALTSALVAGGVLLFNQSWLGDALVNFNRYQSVGGFQGQLFVPPFSAILSIPLSGALPLWKSAYLLGHLLFALTACAFAIREAATQRGESAGDRLALFAGVWLVGNTLFAVSIGSVPGVNDFHRYLIPALPAAFYALRRYLPRTALVWSIVTVFSLALAISGARQ